MCKVYNLPFVFFLCAALASWPLALEAGGGGEQVVFPDPAEHLVSPDSPVRIEVFYTTEPLDDSLSGLGLRVHFDSSQLSFGNLANVLPNGLFSAEDRPSEDVEDLDGDPATDQRVNVAWVDIISRNWPDADLPVRLFSADFWTTTGFTGPTTVRFSASSTASGFVLSPQAAVVRLAESPPTAEAGPDQTVLIGDSVTLDGSGSSDRDGDRLSFGWSFTQVPASSSATLDGTTSLTPSFVVDAPGEYVVELVVNDGAADSAPDTVTISTENSAPAAHAGYDQTVSVGETAILDGSGSSDVDGDLLSHVWALIRAPPASSTTLVDVTSVRPSLLVDTEGSYVVALIVRDGAVDSTPGTVTISTENSAPVADAGPDQSVPVGENTMLDGAGSSDVDGDLLAFTWSLTTTPPGSNATLSNPRAVRPSFITDVPGLYVAQLMVNDGVVDGTPDTVLISTTDSRPVADAGHDQTVVVNDTVVLDGSSSSDPDGSGLTFAWGLTSRPRGSQAVLFDANSVSPTFVLDAPGDYVVQLIARDGAAHSAPDSVAISTENSRPLAAAGADQTVLALDLVELDGGGSRDADGDPLEYSWSFLSVPEGAAATLSDPTQVTTTFPASVPGTYVVQLVVGDGTWKGKPDTVVVTTEPPTADAGMDQMAPELSTVTLDGSGSRDPLASPLSFEWMQIAGMAADSLSGADTATPTLTVPSLDGDQNLVFQLTVRGLSGPASDTVTVRGIDADLRTARLSVPAGSEATVLAGGARAVLFEGTVSWETPLEDGVWTGIRFTAIGRGDESALLSGLTLYLDTNGNGDFDSGDERLGKTVSIANDDAQVTFDFLASPRRLEAGNSQRFFLVADIASDVQGAGIPLGVTLAWIICVFLYRRSRKRGQGTRCRRTGWRVRLVPAAGALALCMLTLSGFSCGGGGGGGGRGSASLGGEVQFGVLNSKDLFLRGAATGVAGRSTGVPLEGPRLAL